MSKHVPRSPEPREDCHQRRTRRRGLDRPPARPFTHPQSVSRAHPGDLAGGRRGHLHLRLRRRVRWRGDRAGAPSCHRPDRRALHVTGCHRRPFGGRRPTVSRYPGCGGGAGGRGDGDPRGPGCGRSAGPGGSGGGDTGHRRRSRCRTGGGVRPGPVDASTGKRLRSPWRCGQRPQPQSANAPARPLCSPRRLLLLPTRLSRRPSWRTWPSSWRPRKPLRPSGGSLWRRAIRLPSRPPPPRPKRHFGPGPHRDRSRSSRRLDRLRQYSSRYSANGGVTLVVLGRHGSLLGRPLRPSGPIGV